MKFEIKRETRREAVWHYVYRDDQWVTTFIDYKDAKKYIEDEIYDIQHPPVIETIETFEI